MPEFNPNDYQRKILQGRRIVMSRSLGDLEADILRLWRQELRSVILALRRGDISPQAADRLRRQITAAIQRWTAGTDNIVKIASNRAIGGIRLLHEELLKDLQSKVSVRLNYSFEGFNVDALEGMFVRRGINVVNSFKTLQNLEVSSTVVKPLGQFLVQAVRSDVPWTVTTAKIGELLSMSSDMGIGQLRAEAIRSGVSMLDVLSGGFDKIDFSVYGDELGQKMKGILAGVVRKLLFNARRIAQTEVDVAAHEGERVAAVRNPIVQGLQWKTSGRHRVLNSAPDVCDIFERYNFHGLGAGAFFAESLPAKPHPFDGCTRLFVFRQAGQWDQPKKNPGQPAMISEPEVAQILGGALTSQSRDLTPGFINRTTNLANQYVQLAWITFNQIRVA